MWKTTTVNGQSALGVGGVGGGSIGLPFCPVILQRYTDTDVGVRMNTVMEYELKLQAALRPIFCYN